MVREQWPEAWGRAHTENPAPLTSPALAQVRCWLLPPPSGGRAGGGVGGGEGLLPTVDSKTPPKPRSQAVYFSLEVLAAVPLSKIIQMLGLSAPKSTGPLEKRSRAHSAFVAVTLTLSR